MDVNSILENPVAMAEFALRLQNHSEGSEEMQLFKQLATKLRIGRTPKGIHNLVAIHQTSQFFGWREQWLTLRLVCKSWKSVIENNPINECLFIWSGMNNEAMPKKLLSKFTNLWIYLDDSSHEKVMEFAIQSFSGLSKLNVDVGAKLDEVSFEWVMPLKPKVEDFLAEFLPRSEKSLKYLMVDFPYTPPGKYPKLEKYEFTLRGTTTSDFIQNAFNFAKANSVKHLRLNRNDDECRWNKELENAIEENSKGCFLFVYLAGRMDLFKDMKLDGIYVNASWDMEYLQCNNAIGLKALGIHKIFQFDENLEKMLLDVPNLKYLTVEGLDEKWTELLEKQGIEMCEDICEHIVAKGNEMLIEIC